MSIQTFADQLQLDLGAITSDSDVSNWIAGWSNQEGTAASNNPLACTVPMPGSSYFNCLRGCSNNLPCSTCTFGVQNYQTERDGAQATALNLKEPALLAKYAPLVSAIATHDKQALGITGSPSQGVIDALNTWCGCSYGNMAGSFASGNKGTINNNFNNQSTNNDIGSCNQCLIGVPGQCPDNQQCVVLSDSGEVLLNVNFGPIGSFVGVCVANDYASTHVDTKSDSSASDSVAVCKAISSGAQQEPPTTTLGDALSKQLPFGIGPGLIKFVAGLALFLVGIGLAYEIFTNQPVVAQSIRGIKGTATKIGAMFA